MTTTTTNHGPGFVQYPGHRVETKPSRKRVRVKFGGEVIADTTDAVLLEETGHQPVYYIPRRDVKMDRLERTNHHTECPFKGEASYFSIRGKRTAENAVWTYESPYDEVHAIRERLAFYPDKVDAIEVNDPSS